MSQSKTVSGIVWT